MAEVWLATCSFPVVQNKIDDVLCAEIPDPSVDPELHAIVIVHMVYGL